MDGVQQPRSEGDFDEFYLATRRRLLGQLTVMTADPEQAADVVQEAYAKAWLAWSRVSRLDEPAAWVRKVAWRLAVSQYRRTAVAARFQSVLERRAGGEGVTPQTETALDVQDALRRLPPAHRQVLVLHELVGLSVAEVADEAGVPVGTVKSRLSRGRAALAELLGAEYAPQPLGDREPARHVGAATTEEER